MNVGLSPVFGRLERYQDDRVRGHLHLAEERMLALQSALAERSGSWWITSGVELHVIDESGQACICGSVEPLPGSAFALTFEGELRPRNYYDDDPLAGTLGWHPKRRTMATDAGDLEGMVYVYPEREHRWSPQQEVALVLAERRYHRPEQPAAAYANLWTEISELAASRPLEASSWKPAARG